MVVEKWLPAMPYRFSALYSYNGENYSKEQDKISNLNIHKSLFRDKNPTEPQIVKPSDRR